MIKTKMIYQWLLTLTDLFSFQHNAALCLSVIQQGLIDFPCLYVYHRNLFVASTRYYEFIEFLTSAFIEVPLSPALPPLAWFIISLPSDANSVSFSFTESYFSAMASVYSLTLSFTESANPVPFSAIFLLVSVPLSGANKIPRIAPAAAPANTLANTFPEPIICGF